MTDFARARMTMVDTQLRTSTITDRRILGVMGRLPRERFVPAEWQDLAYTDADIPLGAGDPPRYLSQPVPLARLIQLADIEETDNVLVIGTGTGYSAAVLAGLAATVVAVEPVESLAETARANLSALAVTNAHVRQGPLDIAASEGPYDVIVMETVVPEAPKVLFSQLKDRGRLVTLIGKGMTAVAHVFLRSGKDIAGRADFNASLPVLEKAPARDTFVF